MSCIDSTRLHLPWQEHLPEFRALALRLTHNEHQAQDLLQDTIYLVMKNSSKFREGTNFVAWVKAILRNQFITGYRQRKHRRELLDRDQPRSGWLHPLTVDNPAEGTMGGEEIMRLIEALPANFRRAFLLHYRGLRYRDIARLTNVPVGTAKSRVNAARTLLRERITLRAVVPKAS